MEPKEFIGEVLALSPQSRASIKAVYQMPEEDKVRLFGEDPLPSEEEIDTNLDDMVESDAVEEYEDGEDNLGNPILMYKLVE